MPAPACHLWKWQAANGRCEHPSHDAGREHYERRKAQAAAAQKPRLKSKHDYDWKKDN